MLTIMRRRSTVRRLLAPQKKSLPFVHMNPNIRRRIYGNEYTDERVRIMQRDGLRRIASDNARRRHERLMSINFVTMERLHTYAAFDAYLATGHVPVQDIEVSPSRPLGGDDDAAASFEYPDDVHWPDDSCFPDEWDTYVEYDE